LLVFGRIGLAFTLFFSLPLLTLPCRDVIFDLMGKWRRFVAKRIRYVVVVEEDEGGGGGR